MKNMTDMKNRLLAQAFFCKLSHALALASRFTARLAAASGISRITAHFTPPPPPPPAIALLGAA